ncbi:MAG: dynamin family protein [Candidatus Scalindua sp.]|nr:dynamin family protein [Candidatus Scalindua sp.]
MIPPIEKPEKPSERNLSVYLEEIITQINNAGEDFCKEIQMLEQLKERLTHGYFNLAVLGQFKRGKSTFLNALLGEEILPTSVVPLTAVPIFIRYHSSLSVKIRFEGNSDEKEYPANRAQDIMDVLSKFVAEENNPKNLKGVAEAEVLCSTNILSKGIVLIDTPGIGSTFRHNTEVTLNFLPQCDAALFLVSADPPITEVEVEFLKHLKTKVSLIFFILNKVDYLDEEERQKALNFFKQVLKEEAGYESDPVIFSVSAKLGLRSRLDRDSVLWHKSGMEEVRAHLVDFCLAEKTSALYKTIYQKASHILNDIIMRIRLALSALQMPLEDLKSRLAVFTKNIQEIQQERITAKDILSGDRVRMHELLEEGAEKLRERARHYLQEIVREITGNNAGQNINEQVVQEVLSESIIGFFEHEFGLMTEYFKAKRDEVLIHHHQRVDSLVDTIRKAASELFEIPCPHDDISTPLTIIQKPYWVTHKWSSSLNPVPQALSDKFFSLKQRRVRSINRLMEQIDKLLVPNVENVRWSIFQTMEREFILFGNTLDRQFEDTVSATHGAILASLKKRKEHAEEIAGEIRRLNIFLEKLEDIPSLDEPEPNGC